MSAETIGPFLGGNGVGATVSELHHEVPESRLVYFRT